MAEVPVNDHELLRQASATLGLGAPAPASLRLLDVLPAAEPTDWRLVAAALAPWLKQRRAQQQAPLVVGLAGGQGAGKSTLARLLVEALRALGLHAATLSLDDVYHTRAARAALAERIHPLLATRGVPGTHDLGLLWALFESLTADRIKLPLFDKGLDDRAPVDDWPTCTGPLDVLVFEGWCLGVQPQQEAELEAPMNALEAEEDADGHYRHYVNRSINDHYRPVWAHLDAWLFLAVPSFEAVRRWRGEQEQALLPERRMDPAQLDRFCAHYERLTRQLLRTAPAAATWTLRLNENHRVEFREDSAAPA
ncbi:MAG: hypothetical protein AAGG11_00135 [Pseudomonadota bacterium]